MLKHNKYLKNASIVFSFLLLVACTKEDSVEKSQKQVNETASAEVSADQKEEDKETKTKEADKAIASVKAEEISWDKLIPADYDPNAAITGYLEKLNNLQDGDQEAMEIYGKIQAVLDNAPVNKELDGRTIKMPGFVAPLENDNGIINEFLLVPYFGACIHTPPPPVNQTVMIKADTDQGVKSEDSSLPVWITGKLKAVEDRTRIGTAGYRIENAKIEPYNEN